MLPSDVPLILGMQFLSEARPSIDWLSRKVSIAGHDIQVVSDAQKAVVHVVQQEAIPSRNSFDALEVSECAVVPD